MKLEPLHPVQIARFRAMSAEEKREVAEGFPGTVVANIRAGHFPQNE